MVGQALEEDLAQGEAVGGDRGFVGGVLQDAGLVELVVQLDDAQGRVAGGGAEEVVELGGQRLAEDSVAGGVDGGVGVLAAEAVRSRCAETRPVAF
ncbi:hypothetical protein ACQ86D_28225 [Streptomyces galilaeus]